MKAIISILVLTTLAAISLKAQTLVVSPVVERTVAGWQWGSSISVQTKTLWSFGAFYQQDAFPIADEMGPANFWAPLSTRHW